MKTTLKEITLSEKEIIQIYNKHMKSDFPENELKPLNHILSLIQQNAYVCKGFFSNDKLKSYTFFAGDKNSQSCSLLDFFAVNSECRGFGIGSDVIKQLKENKEFSKDGIIAEIEDPEHSESEEEKIVRKRRAAFYEKNGFIKTGITSVCFGVHFLIIYLPKEKQPNDDIISEKLNTVYKTVFPKNNFYKNIKINRIM